MDNQTLPDSEGVTLYLLAEGTVFLLSLLRIFVVAIVLAVNIIALRSSSAASGTVKCQCLQSYISDSVKLCSVVYILSWTPFLFYSLLNGRWILIDEHIFCLIQNYVTNAVCLVLVSLAALLAWHKARHPGRPQPKLTGALTLSAWLLPQIVYFLILTTVDNEEYPAKLDFDFLDDLFKSENKTTGKPGLGYKIGFTICGQMLCRLSLVQYIVQYFVVILPPAAMALVALVTYKVRRWRRSSSQKNDNKIALIEREQFPGWCTCAKYGESPALEIILTCNVFWMAVLRPWVLMTWPLDHLFVDLGSHLMLTVAAVFAPILPSQLTKSEDRTDQTEGVTLEDNKIGSSTA